MIRLNLHLPSRFTIGEFNEVNKKKKASRDLSRIKCATPGFRRGNIEKRTKTTSRSSRTFHSDHSLANAKHVSSPEVDKEQRMPKSAEEHSELQRIFDELAAKYDTDQAQRNLAAERRIRLTPLVREHQQFLARSWEAAKDRVIC